MKVTLFQTDIVWGDTQSNLEEAERLIEAERLQAASGFKAADSLRTADRLKAGDSLRTTECLKAADRLKAAEHLIEAESRKDAGRGSDLYVFPEMFTTGFATQEGSRIDETPEKTIAWMHRMADRTNAAIVGSIAMRACAPDEMVSEARQPSLRSSLPQPDGCGSLPFTWSRATTGCCAPDEMVSEAGQPSLRSSLPQPDGCGSLPFTRSRATTGCCASDTISSEKEFTQPTATKLVNRLVFVKPGETGHTFYDKRHLFTYGGEPDRFSAGDKRVIVEFRGVRFLLLVCYDIRFPVWTRNRADYDAIICVANWPDVRQEAWDTLTRARAIENQCFVLAVNRSGKDPVCNYLGGTTLYNPYGQVVARAEDYSHTAVHGEIDMNLLESFRTKFPVLDDADRFAIF